MRSIVALTALAISASSAFSEPVKITVDPARVRNIGGVTKFDRAQFITIHESFGGKDLTEEDRRYLKEGLEARYGRDGGFLSSQAKRVKADPKNPEMPDVADIQRKAKEFRATVSTDPSDMADMRDVIFCTHPELMHAMPENRHAAWGPRSYEAVAEFEAQMLKHYFTSENRPRYLEVFNEPFVKADRIGTTLEAMAEQHNVVAKRVRELNPDVLVGGYSAAWVELEMSNFNHWKKRQKMFMDVAGENMDFFSYHVYDGVNVEGNPRVRTGSNTEALMDITDSYSHLKFGVAKPLMITEFGMIPEGGMEPMTYSAARSARMLYALNGQLMTYLDHPDRLMRVVPFILGKGMWTYDSSKGKAKPGEANCFLLWRKDAEGRFVETDLSKYYQLWKGVAGEWRWSSSSNPDVRVQTWADDKRLIVALANLDHGAQQVELGGLENLEVDSVLVRTLGTDGDAPELKEVEVSEVPNSLKLADGMGALLFIRLKEAVEPKAVVREHRVYATEYLKDIEAEKPIRFRFEKVPTGSGTAILRLSPGRELGRQVLPGSVRFNGKPLAIPSNWAGDDQAGRANFFGMIEVPVDMKEVTGSCEVEVVYPDTGGKLASAVLQVNRNEGL